MSDNQNVLVLKVGGALLQCEMGMDRLMTTVATMLANDQLVVMIHGGGYLVEQQLAANEMQTTKYQGLRVTPAEQMPVITGALAGTSNKLLQGAAQKAGVVSVGISLADANLVSAKVKDEQLGMVGEVEPNDASYLEFVLSKGWMPIVSSIAMTDEGELLNVNADQAATAIAKLVQGQLVLLSDVSGVLDGKGELIASLDKQQISELIKQGVIESGMKVKVEAALEVAESMQQSVQVASWRDAKQLSALAQGLAVGTQIKV